MERFNIDTCAMLVELNISVWTARKLDRKVSDEVVVDKKAGSKGAARVNKNLLAGRNELDVIGQHASAVRNYVYSMTMPWSDSGTGIRLLPAVRFAEFNSRMLKEEAQHVALVDSFVNVYPSLITAQAMALGDMFDRNEYPAPDRIRNRFSFNVSYLPVPKAGDFRVDVGNQATAELQDKLSRLADERIAKAMDDVRTRLKDHMQRMSDRLSIDIVDEVAKPRRFHDTLVESGLELCDLAKSLNIINDPDIEAARRGLEQALTGVNAVTVKTKKATKELSVADTLREDMHQREATKAKVDALLNKLSW
ncbi:MAG: hypothetical protein ACO3SE_07905 [Sedimenticolaceae bacterium]